MTARVSHDVLRRMVSPPPAAPEDVPITSSRAVRLAITRAADKSHDLALSVDALREEVLSLDNLLAVLEPTLMLVGLISKDRITGLAAVDPNLRGALVELQTIGKVLPDTPDDREATGTDAQLAAPLVASFLEHLQDTATHTPLDGWGSGFQVGPKINSTRAAGLILDDGMYRLIRLRLDLGTGGRQAELVVALPNAAEIASKVVKPEVQGDWETRFRTVVDGSPAKLEAVLHRFNLQLHQAESLSVGQILPLPGCTVGSVKLLAGDGRKVATARLGQSGGMRAVRIEAAPHIKMDDLGQLAGAGLPHMNESHFAMDAPPPILGMEDNEMAMDVPGFDVQMDVPDETNDIAMPMEVAPIAPIEGVESNEPSELSWDNDDSTPFTEAEEAPALDWSNEEFET